MSFVREALTVAVLEALRPAAAMQGAIPFPTTAGHRVFVERVGALDDLSEEEPYPTVVIYTERDVGTSGDGAGPPYNRQMDLALDLTVLVLSQPVDDDGAPLGPPVLTVPRTDRELATSLNALESQVREALLRSPSGQPFRSVAQKIRTITSEPDRGGEEGIKFAARRLTLALQVPDDCYVGAPATAPVGTARLPQPMRRIAEALMVSGYEAEIAAALAEAAPVAPVATPFAGLSLAIDLNRDGAADIAATVDLTQD
ncbi:hypothetical protein V5F32_00815 [Xanthobacter oligotrophicus]|uniref:DUF4255 domain-containing protein n=1 Tax=Xanthobacter oligotrophicus TaxID=2607286 RepID=A0ABW6ZSG5_9HYPH